jgi:threonine-phosphate decarboxylase
VEDIAVYEHGGNLYQAARLKGGNLGELLDFSANINPLGISPAVSKRIVEQLPHIIHYPDAQATDLKAAISTYYRVPTEQIIAGNGAVELLYLLCHMLHPKRVVVPAPTFSEYERAAIAAGAEIDYCFLQETSDFAFELSCVLKAMTAKSIVFLGNPNNPTGGLISREDITRVVAAAAELDSLVVIDESFIDFIENDDKYTCRWLVDQYPNLVIVHSLTKFYAIPGLRLGFAIADPALVRLLHKGKDPWNVNSLAQAAGVAALADQEYRQLSRRVIVDAKTRLFQDLSLIGSIKAYSPSVNYILINIAKTGLSAAQMRKQLFAHHILIRDCSNYPGLGNHFIRVAVKLPEQNRKLIEALQQILAGEEHD